jgi:hypothetical protein
MEISIMSTAITTQQNETYQQVDVNKPSYNCKARLSTLCDLDNSGIWQWRYGCTGF